MNKQKRRNLPALDTDVTDPHGSTTEVQGSGVIELGDIGDHLGKLGETILTTQKLVHLVTDQLQVLSVTIPVLRALEIVCVQFRLIISALGPESRVADEGAQGAVERMPRKYGGRA